MIKKMNYDFYFYCKECEYNDLLLEDKDNIKEIPTTNLILRPKDKAAPDYLYVDIGEEKDLQIYVKVNNLSHELIEMINVEVGGK